MRNRGDAIRRVLRRVHAIHRGDRHANNLSRNFYVFGDGMLDALGDTLGGGDSVKRVFTDAANCNRKLVKRVSELEC